MKRTVWLIIKSDVFCGIWVDSRDPDTNTWLIRNEFELGLFPSLKQNRQYTQDSSGKYLCHLSSAYTCSPSLRHYIFHLVKNWQKKRKKEKKGEKQE